jgi:polyhydroxyalkanoate synthesis regulator phasin
MMIGIDLQLITTACALIACACAIWVARRAGDWRQSDEAKKLVGRVDVLETKVTAVESKVKELPTQAQIAGINERINGLATKAEMAAIQSDVRSLVREVGKIDSGVTRIESFLMEHGK